MKQEIYFPCISILKKRSSDDECAHESFIHIYKCATTIIIWKLMLIALKTGPYLYEESIIIMYSVSYHSTLIDYVPKMIL
jgi:hypothetical protein